MRFLCDSLSQGRKAMSQQGYDILAVASMTLSLCIFFFGPMKWAKDENEKELKQNQIDMELGITRAGLNRLEKALRDRGIM